LRSAAVLICICCICALLDPSRAAAAAAKKPPVLLILQAPRGASSLLGEAETELQRSKRYRVVVLQALVPLMQQADGKAGLRTRAAELVEEGRKAMVALDHATAQAKLTEARDLLRGGFVRHYDPRVLAQIHLLLGVVALEQLARPDLARQDLVEVHHLDPSFTLDAHYSPKVRAAFEDAGRSLPPQPVPAAGEVGRLAELAGAKVAMVLSVQAAGEQSLIQGSVFSVEKKSYTGVESRLVNPKKPDAVQLQGKALGAQLRGMLESHFPPPPKPKIVKIKKPPPPPPTPPTPWYLRWYTLTAAGAIVAATAIAVPLALRKQTSDVVVEW
jgi:hypothetical protein